MGPVLAACSYSAEGCSVVHVPKEEEISPSGKMGDQQTVGVMGSMPKAGMTAAWSGDAGATVRRTFGQRKMHRASVLALLQRHVTQLAGSELSQ